MKMFNLKDRKGFTLVELMIVVAIIGILAALAIPAFLRYIKQSKTAEAESMMKKMAEGSKAYFTSEQRYSKGAPSGDQPWHAGEPNNANSKMFGMPVPWSANVFPGGSAMVFCSHNVGALCVKADAAAGGSKKMPDDLSGNDLVKATLNKMRVAFEDPTYFVYNYSSTNAAVNATVDLAALADFDTVSPEVHTVTQSIRIDPTSQEPEIAPAYTTFEFE